MTNLPRADPEIAVLFILDLLNRQRWRQHLET